ncbi:hypothetical protein N7478_011089 [Penicillium angulare]|uniref:uncharacterized protein n=1 Tax=Penicillium angulare TaxID=116970 RepID=UPI0025417291|nr:uncharacterized protein N7478_011089 [Penicillium angulare]KAJ5263484.1 hypothetical protein N7478_011089 [Penicillium angulare]
MPDEKTFFRHIDVKIWDLLQTGRGANILQGSVSFKDDNLEYCTEILPGMHDLSKLRSWWEDLAQDATNTDNRNHTDGFVQGIQPWMWAADYVRKYNTDWEKEVCAAGDLRLSLPMIPHGSIGPATAIRQAILPWFVAVKADGTTLDTPESGSWEEISAAHRDIVAIPALPQAIAVLFTAV